MRVLVVALFTAFTTVAYSGVALATTSNNNMTGTVASVELQTKAIWPFSKKKKIKTSNRLKKKNRRMGKKFRKQNDDTLRR
jgi:hypothetical protein